MALDFALLDAEGTPEPEHELSLSIDMHCILMDWARELKLQQLLRTRNYFRDVDFTLAETKLLATEVATAKQHVASDELENFLEKLQTMLKFANETGRTIHTITD
jgi:hypothetical protein